MIKLVLIIFGVIFVIARLFRRSKNKFSASKFVRLAKNNPEKTEEIIDTLDFPYKSFEEKQIDINELEQKIKTYVFANYKILDMIPSTNALLIYVQGKYQEHDTTISGHVGDVTKTRYDLFAIKNLGGANKVTIYGSMYETAAEKNVISVFLNELETIINSSQREVILDLMDKMKNALGEQSEN
jgi:hypothetical protein